MPGEKFSLGPTAKEKAGKTRHIIISLVGKLRFHSRITNRPASKIQAINDFLDH